MEWIRTAANSRSCLRRGENTLDASDGGIAAFLAPSLLLGGVLLSGASDFQRFVDFIVVGEIEQFLFDVSELVFLHPVFFWKNAFEVLHEH